MEGNNSFYGILAFKLCSVTNFTAPSFTCKKYWQWDTHTPFLLLKASLYSKHSKSIILTLGVV